MLHNKTVAVVIPAFNEERQIRMVLESIPDFIDRIIIVNDGSTDKTSEIVMSIINADKKDYSNSDIAEAIPGTTIYDAPEQALHRFHKEEDERLTESVIANKNPEKDRIILIEHIQNSGVGAAVSTGYSWCRQNNIFCTAKVDGDGQMDPRELERICEPVITNNIDYVKGNRLLHRSSKLIIPNHRFWGNSVLSILTKIASGYWKVSDTQTAFTAISLRALKILQLDKIYKKYGYPNDILVRLNIASCTLTEVEIKPIYNIGEQSKMKIFKLVPRILKLLTVSFFRRLWLKYFIRDFHPLFLFYFLSFFLFIIDIPFFIELIRNFLVRGNLTPDSWLIIYIFLTISSFQAFLFAMWMDIQDNERLYK
ncbi:MAG: glycosyltransferase family 2 protein [Bacteroidota bacterium]|nr:glycosyltransferase family 2 protein [Bacteroidota bacterium]